MGVTVTTTGTEDPPIESPTYTDTETGIEYTVDDDGHFVAPFGKSNSLTQLRAQHARYAAEDAEKAAEVERRQRLATIVDSDSTYVLLGRGEAVKHDLTPGRPLRVKVRTRAARGGWNVTVLDGGKKIPGLTVYDFDADQLRRLAELDLDITRAEFQTAAHDAKLRSPIGQPDDSAVRTGPTSWTVTTRYYVDDDGTLSRYRSFGSTPKEVEVQGVHEVSVDPVTGVWSSEGYEAESLRELRQLLAKSDDVDHGKPATNSADARFTDSGGPEVGTYDAFAGYSESYSYIIEDPTYDRAAHVAAYEHLNGLRTERRELLDAAIVGEPTEEES